MIASTPLGRGRRAALRSLVVASLAGAGLVACSSSTTSVDKVCEPGHNSDCACENGTIGKKTCNAEGTAYGACGECTTVNGNADAGAPPIDGGTDAKVELCPNGVVDPGEGCDDGNGIPDDGCGKTCVPEGNPTSANLCPGQPVHVWDTPVTFDGTTNNYGAGYMAKMSNDCTGFASESGGPDHVYAVTPHQSGMMTVTTKVPVSSPTFQNTIYVRTECDNQDSQAACANLQSVGNGETITFNALMGLTYYVFIDSGLQSGDYTVTFEVK